MDILQETALAIIGFAGGVSVAAGTFALITALGIIPRLASRMGVAFSNENRRCRYYYIWIICGNICGLSFYGTCRSHQSVSDIVSENKLKLWNLSVDIYDGSGQSIRYAVSDVF